MNTIKRRGNNTQSEAGGEAGQSLVLITMLIVILLAFAGLAADVGMLFARSSQFSSAVDAATLAGVVDLPSGLDAAEQRAEEFLDANRWPVANAIATDRSQSTTPLGYPEFSYTVTYPVETYFLTLLGFDEVPVTRAASAAIYSWADMPTATQAELGLLRTAGQYAYGPDSCTAQSDPVSSKWSESGVPNPLRTETEGKYTYRIRIPGDYGGDVEVQLFDPDSLNLRTGTSDTITPSDGSAPYSASCSTMGNGDSCFISTGEDTVANPVWLRRLDETWQDVGVGCPVRAVSTPDGDTVTRYDLYYFDDNGDRVEQASFQTGSGIDHHTDMRWVTPGEDANVPTVAGTFRIASGTISALPQDGDDYRNVYLDVTTVAGTSKNGWDVWAGPPDPSLPADGNERNLYILDNLSTFSTDGIEIFALGYLPTYSYFNRQLPVASVTQALGGSRLSVTIFDLDPPAGDSFVFGYSSVPSSDLPEDEDWALTAECNGSSDCNNKWIEPPFNLLIPGPDDGVAFYGGYLTADYSMNGDEHVWSVTLPLGRAFLTR